MAFTGFARGVGPVVTLAGATTTAQVGTTVDFGQPVQTVAFSITTSAGVSAGAVTMQISADGTNWVAPPTAAFVNNSAGTLANPYTLTAAATVLFTLTAAGVRYARVGVSTNVVGGAVSATVSGV